MDWWSKYFVSMETLILVTSLSSLATQQSACFLSNKIVNYILDKWVLGVLAVYVLNFLSFILIVDSKDDDSMLLLFSYTNNRIVLCEFEVFEKSGYH